MTSCVSLKPVCPTIPIYPHSTALGYSDKEDITRTTMYQVAASSSDVITFFKQHLEQNEWSIVHEDSTGFSMGYRTTNSQPPFLLSLRINQEKADMLEYSVSIAIQGPFAWRNWCSTLKP
jgi:hypothetical protein